MESRLAPEHCYPAVLDDADTALRWTAEFDPLRDEGLAYAVRLVAAGVDAELHHVAGTIHGYDTALRQAQGAAAAHLRPGRGDGLPISAGVITTAHASQHDFLRRTPTQATPVEEWADG